ncbi:MAG: hypothetical protein JJ971_01475 [Balneolaceae bacterium]|nr:hypothetical protein [Balneolaceae bacterium]MBO6545042.1 hypothetical protein [Balneolaceae bacterium]MBO6646438.1 hypothetical protein [Balneolaceae bacterium]
MSIKHISLLIITMGFSMSACGKTNSLEPIAVTEKYEFYSNFWINQHHFLYAKASSAAKGNWDDGFTENELDKLSVGEAQILKDGITFYRDSVISYSLTFNRGLTILKRTLINFDEDDVFEMDDFHDELVEHLNKVKPVYRKYFWGEHNRSNLEVVDNHLEFITTHESEIFDRISGLAQQPWREEKIRVDVTYYANWAGAYTSNNPQVHVTITSQDDGKGDWQELIFHEPSHSIMSSRSFKAAELISKVSEQLGVEPPESLWHALLFYFSGVSVQEAFKKEGVEYELYMVRYNVFDEYHPVIFKYMPDYVQGDTSFEEALKKVIAEYEQY